MEKNELFESLPVPVALRRMIVPAAVSQIIVLIYNMADTFYIGRTNNPYMLAGASLILPVFNMLLCLSSLAGIGGGTLLSRLLGAGQEAEARKVSAFSFWLAIGLSLAFSVALGAFMGPALRFLGAGENIFLFARQYSFCVIVLGAVPTVLSNVMAHLVRSIGYSKEAGFGITLGAVLNIALDPVFMYLLLPDGQQVLGVGIATLLSNCVACGYFLLILWQIRQHTVLTADPRTGLPKAENIRAVFGVGVPSAVASLLFDLDYVVIDKLMVAYNCAARNAKRMNQVIGLSLATGLVVAAGSILLYEAFTPWIVRVFIADPDTVALATTFLRIRILATPLMFLSFFTVYIFQGFGKGGISLFLGVVRWAVFNIPMLYLLNFLVGMYGIVWSQIAADILTVAVSAYVYRTRRPAFGRA